MQVSCLSMVSRTISTRCTIQLSTLGYLPPRPLGLAKSISQPLRFAPRAIEAIAGAVFLRVCELSHVRKLPTVVSVREPFRSHELPTAAWSAASFGQLFVAASFPCPFLEMTGSTGWRQWCAGWGGIPSEIPPGDLGRKIHPPSGRPTAWRGGFLSASPPAAGPLLSACCLLASWLSGLLLAGLLACWLAGLLAC